MFHQLKNTFSQLAHGKPGEQFQRHYRQRQQAEQEHPWKTVLYTGLGLLLVVTGLLLSLPPGVPGFLLTIPGLGLLAARSHMIARWLDRAELFLRHAWQWVWGTNSHKPRA